MVSTAIGNIRINRKYYIHLINSLLAALMIHFLIFYFFPPFEFNPYVLSEMESFELVMPDVIEFPPPPEEVVQPRPMIIPSEEGEDVSEIDVPPNIFNNFDNVPLLQDSKSIWDQGFYAFEEMPVLKKYVNPIYPELARQAGIEGTVLILVLIGEDGKVLSVSVIRSDVTPAMERAAVNAAKQFEFEPAKQRTISVRARMTIPITFKLR